MHIFQNTLQAGLEISIRKSPVCRNADSEMKATSKQQKELSKITLGEPSRNQYLAT